jgi:hypothetical protein
MDMSAALGDEKFLHPPPRLKAYQFSQNITFDITKFPDTDKNCYQ